MGLDLDQVGVILAFVTSGHKSVLAYDDHKTKHSFPRCGGKNTSALVN